MSRGPGKLQRRILGSLRSDGPAQVNELCWRLATDEGRITSGPPREIEKTFYSSFLRAVNRLDGQVKRSRRKLQHLDDLVSYYPFKTRSVEIKRLREELLPIIRSYLSTPDRRKFRKSQTERHLLSLVPSAKMDAARLAWPRFDDQLFDLLPSTRGERRDVAFSLIAKGRQLFVPSSHVGDTRSFEALIELALQRGDVSSAEQSMYATMKELFDQLLPPETLSHTLLKSQLYSIANFKRSIGSSYLSDDIKAFLLQEAPRLVESLPGHVPKHSRLEIVGRMKIPTLFKVEYSRSLNELIRRDALGSFEFLSLPE